MKEHSGILPVKKMAQALNISRSRYYSWLTSPPTEHEKRDQELGVIIERIHRDNRSVYGSIRIHRDMKDEGIRCSRKRVARIMREHSLKAADVREIVLWVDSPGGEVVASQSIYLELLELRKEMPVVGSIENLAASGGYYAALATDPIFARPSSTVGNVGAWSSTPLDLPVNENILATGPFKLSATNIEAFTRDLEGIKLEFLATVQAHRGSRLNLSPVDLSQGLAYSGREAQQLGLIDFLGSDTDAVAKAAELAKIKGYEVIDMWEILLERYSEEASAEESAMVPSFFSQTWVGAADPITSERQLPPGIYLLYDVRLRGEK